MKGLLWAVIVVEAIVATVAAVMLFLIFSPSVGISPTLVLTAAIEGVILLALGIFALGVVVLRQWHSGGSQ